MEFENSTQTKITNFEIACENLYLYHIEQLSKYIPHLYVERALFKSLDGEYSSDIFYWLYKNGMGYVMVDREYIMKNKKNELLHMLSLNRTNNNLIINLYVAISLGNMDLIRKCLPIKLSYSYSATIKLRRLMSLAITLDSDEVIEELMKDQYLLDCLLLEQIRLNNIDKIDVLIRKGADINQPLIESISKGNLNLFVLLIFYRANINPIDEKSFSTQMMFEKILNNHDNGNLWEMDLHNMFPKHIQKKITCLWMCFKIKEKTNPKTFKLPKPIKIILTKHFFEDERSFSVKSIPKSKSLNKIIFDEEDDIFIDPYTQKIELDPSIFHEYQKPNLLAVDGMKVLKLDEPLQPRTIRTNPPNYDLFDDIFSDKTFDFNPQPPSDLFDDIDVNHHHFESDLFIPPVSNNKSDLVDDIFQDDKSNLFDLVNHHHIESDLFIPLVSNELPTDLNDFDPQPQKSKINSNLAPNSVAYGDLFDF